MPVIRMSVRRSYKFGIFSPEGNLIPRRTVTGRNLNEAFNRHLAQQRRQCLLLRRYFHKIIPLYAIHLYISGIRLYSFPGRRPGCAGFQGADRRLCGGNARYLFPGKRRDEGHRQFGPNGYAPLLCRLLYHPGRSGESPAGNDRQGFSLCHCDRPGGAGHRRTAARDPAGATGVGA